eukprot:2439205-Pleurochrysis_carterae.AAC.1
MAASAINTSAAAHPNQPPRTSARPKPSAPPSSRHARARSDGCMRVTLSTVASTLLRTHTASA